jgi:hypothetical protein
MYLFSDFKLPTYQFIAGNNDVLSRKLNNKHPRYCSIRLQIKSDFVSKQVLYFTKTSLLLF